MFTTTSFENDTIKWTQGLDKKYNKSTNQKSRVTLQKTWTEGTKKPASKPSHLLKTIIYRENLKT